MDDLLPALVTFRLLALSQVLLFAMALTVSRNPATLRLIGVGLAVSVACYLATPLIIQFWSPTLGHLAGNVSELIPLVLLVFTVVLFDDEPRPAWARWGIPVGYLLLCVASQSSAAPAEVSQGFRLALQGAKLGCTGLAIWIALAGAEHDLLTARIRLRRLFATGIAVLVGVIVSVEVIAAWQVPATVELLGMAAIFGFTLIVNLAFLRFNPGLLLIESEVRQPTRQPEENPLIERLTRSMRDERLYADHDLRIAGLAARLHLPEYQLRRTINQHLGYRNFNQFVNRYRIGEAADRLLSQPNVPILTIALDVGFRSISSFNSAFRAEKERSPSEFRAEGLIDS